MTQRSVNWRFLAVTSALGIVVLAALYVVHGWQVTRTAGGLLVLADRQESGGDWSKAAEYLDRYLRVKPADAQAKIRLAKTYLRIADSPRQQQRAIELHYRALAAGDKAAEIDLRGGLANLLLEAG